MQPATRLYVPLLGTVNGRQSQNTVESNVKLNVAGPDLAANHHARKHICEFTQAKSKDVF